jgi:glycosyltransferase involved in cell wall biosynthesis
LKVGIYLIDLLPAEGGGFSYSERLIHAIDNHPFDPRLQVCFVGRRPGGNTGMKKPFHKLLPNFLHRIFYILNRLGILRFLSRIFFTNLDICNRIDVRNLKRHGIDVLLYLNQNGRYVDNFPFITMNWDIGHKSTFAFPEFVEERSFEFRDKWYTSEIQKAFAIFVESESGKRELAHYFSIPEIKIRVVPLFPGRVAELTVTENAQTEILSRYGIGRLAYFYYPAQFWAHKNHYNLIIAFAQLKKKDASLNFLKLVFTGSDKGNKAYIRSIVKACNLEQDIVMLDFVSSEEVNVLYRNSIALVMPTFLGPTNMPLLEARALNVPVICSDLEGHREICHDSALYIQPADPDSIMNAMQTYLNADIRAEYIERSNNVLKQSVFTIQNAIVALEQSLMAIDPIRKTFA